MWNRGTHYRSKWVNKMQILFACYRNRVANFYHIGLHTDGIRAVILCAVRKFGFFILVWFPQLKIKICKISDQWLLIHSTYNLFWGRLPLKVVFTSSIFILVWSSELQLKIWERTDQWMLRYSTFDILRSSFIGSRLHVKYFSV